MSVDDDTTGTDASTTTGPPAGTSVGTTGGSSPPPPPMSTTNGMDTTADATSTGSAIDGSGSTGEPDVPPTDCEDRVPSCKPPCAPTQVCQAGACVDLGPMHPLGAFDVGGYAWQTLQDRLQLDDGQVCDARITVAVGDQIACYVGADDEMRCAGRVFSTDYGPTFTPTGQTGVEQILIRPTFNSQDGNGICILHDGAISCLGRNNGTGLYGTGLTDDLPDWTAWGSGTECQYSRIATGTNDQICAWRGDGQVVCSGYNFGLSPVAVRPATTGFWITTFGDLNVDDGIWRAQQGRTECQIGMPGLSCFGPGISVPGAWSDGGIVDDINAFEFPWWVALDSSGTVTLAAPNPGPIFEAGRVLAIGYHYYPEIGPPDGVLPGVCAVYDDGSLWCIGANQTGRFGTGAYANLDVATQVQPPGSVRIDCRLP